MDLLGIRQQFIKISGRYDLATTGEEAYDTDNGADFFINSGMRFLDLRYNTIKSQASYFEEVAAGAWFVKVQNCIAIREVWCNDDEGRWQLTRYPYEIIKENYTDLISESDGGSPLYYCPVWLRVTDATDYESLGAFFNYVYEDDDGTYNGIIFTPKTDDAYNIEIVGKFYHVDLSDNDDENFWTNVAPALLVKSALYQLDVFYRGMKSAEHWLSFIEREGAELEMGLVDQESSDERVLE